MSTKLRQKTKYNFQEDFFKLMKNAVFGKNYKKCEKTQKHKTCNNRNANKFFSIRTKLSYNKVFTENLLKTEIIKTQILMNNLVYLGLSILDLGETVM